MVPKILPKQTQITALLKGATIWNMLCDWFLLPDAARCDANAVGTIFPVHDRDRGHDHADEGHGMDRGMGMGQGTWPAIPSPEVMDLVRHFREVRQAAIAHRVSSASWLLHVRQNFQGNADRAHLEWLWIPEANRDQSLDLARKLCLLEEWLLEHGHPDGHGQEEDEAIDAILQHRGRHRAIMNMPGPAAAAAAANAQVTAPHAAPQAGPAHPGPAAHVSDVLLPTTARAIQPDNNNAAAARDAHDADVQESDGYNMRLAALHQIHAPVPAGPGPVAGPASPVAPDPQATAATVPGTRWPRSSNKIERDQKD